MTSAQPPACGPCGLRGGHPEAQYCLRQGPAEDKGSQAHISLLLTSQPIASLTLRLVFCETEMSFTPTSWISVEMR